MPNFTEWAQATSAQTRRCKVCALPAEWYQQVLDARANGYGSVLISRFLTEHGHRVTASSLDNHFNRGGAHGR